MKEILLGLELNIKISRFNFVVMPSGDSMIMLYSRCFEDPHKCGDLFLGRVLSSKFKWDTIIKVVTFDGM